MIKKETLSSLLNSSICIENVFYMQLVTTCSKLSESFLDVFEDDTDNVLKALGFSGSLVHENEVLVYLYDKAPKGVLIHFETPVHCDFLFDSNGDWQSHNSSWDCSWSRRTHLYAYGDSLEEALDNVFKVYHAYVNECAEREKKERGL